MRDVRWFDDFLGKDLAPGWKVSKNAGGGADPISRPLGNGQGGIWMLGLYGGTSPEHPGCAQNLYLHYGGAAPADTIDARHFSPARNLHFEARVFLNLSNADDITVGATVGMTGRGDPDQVLAAIYGGQYYGWCLQARNIPPGGESTPENSVTTGTEWHHTPGGWALFEIDVTWASRTARLSIDGQVLASVCGEMVTPEPLCVEFQLWNKPDPETGIYTAPTMYLDAVGVTQGR